VVPVVSEHEPASGGPHGTDHPDDRDAPAVVSRAVWRNEGPDPTAASLPTVVPAASASDEARRHRLHRLYEAHYQDLVRLACLLLDRTEPAEEVVQDAFVRLFGALDRIEDDAATPAYLRSIVMNGARSQLRRRMVARRHPPMAARQADGADVGVVLREDQHEVIDALRTLPERQRACLVLRYYGGCSEAEIAETLGVPRGTVKSNISRAMVAMAARLEGSR